MVRFSLPVVSPKPRHWPVAGRHLDPVCAQGAHQGAGILTHRSQHCQGFFFGRDTHEEHHVIRRSPPKIFFFPSPQRIQNVPQCVWKRRKHVVQACLLPLFVLLLGRTWLPSGTECPPVDRRWSASEDLPNWFEIEKRTIAVHWWFDLFEHA